MNQEDNTVYVVYLLQDCSLKSLHVVSNWEAARLYVLKITEHYFSKDEFLSLLKGYTEDKSLQYVVNTFNRTVNTTWSTNSKYLGVTESKISDPSVVIKDYVNNIINEALIENIIK